MRNLPTLAPQNFSEALQFSELLAKSDFVPKQFQGKPGDILAAIQMGYEVGLSPMAALQNIAVINGRPSMWGDALLGIVQASGLLEAIEETDDGKTATCIVKRKGDLVPRTATFSMDDARVAQLAGKQGPWTQFPKRMRQMRARNFALRDKFADVLKGLIAREEAIDITPLDEIPGGNNPDLGTLSEDETPQAKIDVVMDAPVVETVMDESSAIMQIDDVVEIIQSTNGAEPPADRQLNEEEQTRVRNAWKNAKGGSAEKMKSLGKAVPGFTGIAALKYSQLDAVIKALA